jgi:hypothetical protein
VKRNFGGIEHFIRGVREILGGVNPLTPPSKSHVYVPEVCPILLSETCFKPIQVCHHYLCTLEYFVP